MEEKKLFKDWYIDKKDEKKARIQALVKEALTSKDEITIGEVAYLIIHVIDAINNSDQTQKYIISKTGLVNYDAFVSTLAFTLLKALLESKEEPEEKVATA